PRLLLEFGERAREQRGAEDAALADPSLFRPRPDSRDALGGQVNDEVVALEARALDRALLRMPHHCRFIGRDRAVAAHDPRDVVAACAEEVDECAADETGRSRDRDLQGITWGAPSAAALECGFMDVAVTSALLRGLVAHALLVLCHQPLHEL